MKKFTWFFFFLLIVISMLFTPALAEKETEEAPVVEIDAWTPLDIDLPIHIAAFGNAMIGHVEERWVVKEDGVLRKNATRAYKISDIWAYEAYVVVKVTDRNVRETLVFYPFETQEARDKAILDIWPAFVNYDDNGALYGEWIFSTPWAGIDVFHDDYVVSMFVNDQAEIEEYGPWAIRLSKRSPVAIE